MSSWIELRIAHCRACSSSVSSETSSVALSGSAGDCVDPVEPVGVTSRGSRGAVTVAVFAVVAAVEGRAGGAEGVGFSATACMFGDASISNDWSTSSGASTSERLSCTAQARVCQLEQLTCSDDLEAQC